MLSTICNYLQKRNVRPTYLVTCLLSTSEEPETVRLRGEDINGVEWDAIVTPHATYELHTLFLGVCGSQYAVPNDRITYEVTQKELDEMLESGLSLPHDNKFQYN